MQAVVAILQSVSRAAARRRRAGENMSRAVARLAKMKGRRRAEAGFDGNFAVRRRKLRILSERFSIVTIAASPLVFQPCSMKERASLTDPTIS